MNSWSELQRELGFKFCHKTSVKQLTKQIPSETHVQAANYLIGNYETSIIGRKVYCKEEGKGL